MNTQGWEVEELGVGSLEISISPLVLSQIFRSLPTRLCTGWSSF